MAFGALSVPTTNKSDITGIDTSLLSWFSQSSLLAIARLVLVWDFQTRTVIASFTGDSSINCCAVAPDGVTIVAGESSGRLHFLQLEGVNLTR